MSSERIAIVTGATQGLGKATATALANQGDIVYCTGRSASARADELAHDNCIALDVDVTDDQSVQHAVQQVLQHHGRVDVLVNNAGILIDPGWQDDPGSPSVFDADIDTIARTMETNTYGALRMIQAAMPAMVEHGYGRIVNVSSGMGQLNGMEGGFPAYRLSKVGMNAITAIVHAETKAPNVKINSVCPGWVRTDMGGQNAMRSLEEGIFGIVWAANLPDDGPSGGFFRDGKELPW